MAVPEYIDSNHGEQAIACAELILENKGRFPARPENVQAVKAMLTELAGKTEMNLLTVAMWYMTVHMGRTFDRYRGLDEQPNREANGSTALRFSTLEKQALKDRIRTK